MLTFAAVSVLACAGDCAEPKPKSASVLYPRALQENARANADRFAWAGETREQIVEAAQPWMKMSDDELWDLMFGNTIKRSWMVWSSGFCPACKQGVPMYTWEIKALEQPWKTRCPHCKELFPKNDFRAFYRSGLDEHGVFDPKRADRSLLFNAEHPEPGDPLRGFGVDDGEGYVDGDKRWRFIGAYLIYGQWKQAIVRGACALAQAYVMTGDKAYAHKAGILLDRAADLYPTFDFGKEGVMYEGPPLAGYVSTWHDACWEAQEIAIAYDQAFEGMRDDPSLPEFLAKKARDHKIDNPKATFADVQRNIEDRIFRDTLAHRKKIESNYPQTDITIAVAKTVLNWPEDREEVMEIYSGVLDKATAVDGVTGEKGMAAYGALSPQSVARILAVYSRVDPTFLAETYKRHPRLHDSYRFHIDTWCLGSYYPSCGDGGVFARPAENYAAIGLSTKPGLNPSMFTFMWQLYEMTGDPAFVQVLYRGNGFSLDGLPHDLFSADPEAFRKNVKQVIARSGERPKVGSVDKKQWHLAILRCGDGRDERNLWIDYDVGGGHGHADGMNLGLYARGLDLLPDFGYPPVQYGGWGAPKSRWYQITASHNTVVVDGASQPPCAGKTTLWADGDAFHAVRASCPEMIGGKQYERTAAMVSLSDSDFYVLDVFRVVGGSDHAKFTRSHFGTIDTRGLALVPGPDYGHGAQTRSYMVDGSPHPGWSVDWKIDDRYKRLPAGTDIHLRYTDLTDGAQAWTGEAWVNASMFSGNEESWIPEVMTRRQSKQAPLASTFISVLDPYVGRPNVLRARRLPLETESGESYPDSCAAVEFSLAGGAADLVVAVDAENPLGLSPAPAQGGAVVQKEWGVRTDGELCLVRRTEDGAVIRIALCKGSYVTAGDVELRLKAGAEFVEIRLEDGRAVAVSGDREAVAEMRVRGREVWR